MNMREADIKLDLALYYLCDISYLIKKSLLKIYGSSAMILDVL